MRIGFSTRIGRHMRIGMSVPIYPNYRKPKPKRQATYVPVENYGFADRLPAILVAAVFLFFLIGGFFYLLTSFPH